MLRTQTDKNSHESTYKLPYRELLPIARWSVEAEKTQGRSTHTISLDANELTVGSGPGADLVLPHCSVSRKHATINFTPSGTLRIHDHNSTNGTWIGKRRVYEAELQTATVIRLGMQKLWLIPRSRNTNNQSGQPVIASRALTECYTTAETFAALPWPVLITGESGVGKEMIAQNIHKASGRRGAFVALNAGGLTASVIESQLFGHVRGSFTGADRAHDGHFVQADQGTLFLDEVGELPLELQKRFLRVLCDWRVRPVGGQQERKVDVRLICATHRNLLERVEENLFREDFYYRINRLAIHIPPLRERPRDIPALAEHFLAQARAEIGPKEFTRQALTALCAHRWPGNSRELRNVIIAAAVRAPSASIDAALIRAVLSPQRAPSERERIARTLSSCHGNISAAARQLGLARTTLRDRMVKYGVSR